MTGLRWTQDQLDAHTQRAGLAKVASKVAKYRNTPTPPCSVAGATIEGVKVAAVVRVTIPFPPTVNHSTRPTASGGRILTDAHKAFRRAVAAELQALGGPTIAGRLGVEIHITPPNRRRFDLDNRVKAVLDALQLGGLFDDDEAIDRLTVLRAPIDKGNGRAYVRAYCLPKQEE